MSDKHKDAPAEQQTFWEWKSNPDPWSTSHPAEWTLYTCIENEMMEEMFSANEPYAYLDEFYIDFKRKVQISSNNVHKQRPIRRMVVEKMSTVPLRETRFSPNPLTTTTAFSDMNDARRSIDIVEQAIGATLFTGSNDDFTITPDYVERAAKGIVQEGTLIGRKREAEWLAKQLLKVKSKSNEEIEKVCVNLYTKESFLYRNLNQALRAFQDEQQADTARKTLERLGLFFLIVRQHVLVFTNDRCKRKYLYRGATLSEEMINQFQHSPHGHYSTTFPAFTSCTRSREKAETFGNVLLVIDTNDLNIIDVSIYSDFPDEEEHLIPPGQPFEFQKLEYDEAKKKTVICIKAQYVRYGSL